jgi:site-specific DNA recombinase
VQRLQPSEELFSAARSMFKTLWDERIASTNETRRTLEAKLSTLEQQVEQFLDRIAETDMPSIIAAYEKRIRALEERKLLVSERIANCGRPLPDFDEERLAYTREEGFRTANLSLPFKVLEDFRYGKCRMARP